MEREVTFKTFYWSYAEVDSDERRKLIIHISGMDANGKTVHCEVEGFTPYVYLELPPDRDWPVHKCAALFEYFQKVMKTNGPISYTRSQKYNFYHLDKMMILTLIFPTHSSTAFFAKKLESDLFIQGIGTIKANELKAHEHRIDPILKFTAINKLSLASWITVTETIPKDEVNLDVEDRKFTTADIDLHARSEDIKKAEVTDVNIFPSYVSFDIECYSKNHNSKLPDPEIPENKIFQLANTYGNLGEKSRNTVIYTLFDPLDIEGVTVIRCESEKDLLIRWIDFINDINPDIFIGYNTTKFDWGYIIKRAEILGIFQRLCTLSRVFNHKADVKKISWSSSAYKKQEFRYLEVPGRTNVDILTEVERNYRLPKYNLASVAERFLKDSKDDISPRQLFMLYQLTEKYLPIAKELAPGVVPKSERIKIKNDIRLNILVMRRCSGEVRKLRDKIMAFKKGSDLLHLIRSALHLTGKYNVQDTLLPIDLCKKLNLWLTMEALSNCTYVPLSYLHTRGQQIRVVSQILRRTMFSKIVIAPRKKDKIRYQGATVIDAIPGDYDLVGCFDFESLYPNVIIAGNMCPTMLLKPNEEYPEQSVHRNKWEDHIGCTHDPQHRRKKASDVLCQAHDHRFKKLIIHEDGTMENRGILPALLENLLVERKKVKKEMAKKEYILKCHKGDNTKDDDDYYTKIGVTKINKGSLSAKELQSLEVNIATLNAAQLALKISANSVYGFTGAQEGSAPCVEVAASTTYGGRILIMAAINYIRNTYTGDPKNGYKGKATLVYGDTDSGMMAFRGLTTAETYSLCEEIAKKTTFYLKMMLLGYDMDIKFKCKADGIEYTIDKYPRDKLSLLKGEDNIKIRNFDACPINLQFENLYARYFLLTKKRYIAHKTNKKGEIDGKIAKGVVSTRRDNCAFNRDSHVMTVSAIIDKKSRETIMNLITDRVHALFTQQIPEANLIIYMGISDVIDYAKRDKEEEKKDAKSSKRVYIDANKNRFDDPIGPLDPRLVYNSLLQAELSLKMLRRGDTVPANTRLEYIFLDDPNASNHREKAEDYTYHKENPGLKPDYIHYLEKQMSKPIEELLTVKFPPEQIPAEKPEDAFDRCLAKLDSLLAYKVKSCKIFTKTVEPYVDGKGAIVGWGTLCKKCRALENKKCSIHKNPGVVEARRVYTFSKKEAMIEYILDSARKKKADPTQKNLIDEGRYPELINVCRVLKSKAIMGGSSSRGTIKVGGEKLRISTIKNGALRVMVYPEEYMGYKVKSIGKLVAIKELPKEKREKQKYVYSVEMEDGVVLEDVPRSAFTTIRLKDGDIMKTMLRYRISFKNTIEELKTCIDPSYKMRLAQEEEVDEEEKTIDY